jgi:hypothetical protein
MAFQLFALTLRTRNDRGLSIRLPHRVGAAKASQMMYICRTYSGAEAHDIHLPNLCFADDRFDAELPALSEDIPTNSGYANQVNKRAPMDSHGLTLHDAHALGLFKNERLMFAPSFPAFAAKFPASMGMLTLTRNRMDYPGECWIVVVPDVAGVLCLRPRPAMTCRCRHRMRCRTADSHESSGPGSNLSRVCLPAVCQGC